MNKIEFDIFKTLLKNFLIATFLFLFLGLLTRVFHYMEFITENNGGIFDLMQILLFIQPKIFVVLAPFTLLISSFLTYNSLIHANEHIAIYNFGASEFTIVKPFFYLSFLLFLITLFFSTILVPNSYRKMSHIREDLFAKISASIIKTKQFINHKGIGIFIEDSSEKTSKGVIILDGRNPKEKAVIASDSAKIGFDGNQFFFDGTNTYLSRKTDFSPLPFTAIFSHYRISLFTSHFIDSKPKEDEIVSSKNIIKSVLSGEKRFLKEFKVRFGWAFFVILIPFSVIVILLKYFNFTRNRLILKNVFTSLGIGFYVSSSGILLEGMLNSSVLHLFLYYANIFLIFTFLLFKLKLKNFS